MNNQSTLWDTLHEDGKVNHSLDKPTRFAEEVQDLISANSKIIELGCGVGSDSYYFTQHGHQVLATDFSKVAIDNNKKHFKEDGLKFEILDIGKAMDFPNNSFDVVYARLSLHYFTDKVTREIFKELSRILKPNGLICFLCKSTNDPVYGKGREVEKDMYEENSHIRHFFSKNYIKECLEGLFKIQELETGGENFYNSPSAFVKVIAKNIK